MKQQLFACFLALLMLGCKKDTNVLDSSVQPSGDDLNGDFVSLPLLAITEKMDSVASYNSRNKFIGANQDPVVGLTELGLYLNINMSVSDLNLKSMIYKSASLVLRLDNDKNIGDINSIVNYSVYPVDSSLSTSRVYYTSNTRLHNKTRVIGGGTLRYTTLSSNPVLEIPLDSTYFSTLMKDTAALKGNDALIAKYKGFYIQAQVVSGTQGVIHYADLEDGQSGLYLNYRQASKDSVESFRFSFSGSNAVKFNTVHYSSSSAITPLINQLKGDGATASDVLFVKGMGLATVKINIPALDTFLLNKNLGINRAEIAFNINSSYAPSAAYSAPSEMALVAISASGEDTLVYDTGNATDNGRYDGFYDETNQKYVFNIVRHVQAIKSGKTRNRGFRLVMAYPIGAKGNLRDEYIKRIALVGTGATNGPKLNVSYIKLN
jgi:hypothetical protein